MDFASRIREKAYELGFDLCGIAAAGPSPRGEAFTAWLAQGQHADMAWIAKDPGRRLDPRTVVEGAKSVVCVARSYFVEDPPEDTWRDPLRGRIARYAWGLDYHDVLLPRLRDLEAFIASLVSRPLASRCYVDTGPVLERDVAQRAGLGFIGKHTLLINPAFGSYLLLGEILVDVALEPDAPAGEGGQSLPMADGRTATCGACRRCQDVCPTHAFPVPYVLDARLCISYQTIENKGAIPEDLRPRMGNWIFGCDECQTVCPWVKQFSAPSRDRWLRFDPDRCVPQLADVVSMTPDEFRERFRGTPVARTKRRGLARNAVIALGNSGREEAIPVVERALRHDEPLVREHAAWALARLRGA